MGKRKAFGESLQEIESLQEMLLKRRLGTAKYEQMKKDFKPQIPMKKDFKPQIPKRPVGNLIYDEAGVWEQKKLDAWKFGEGVWTIPAGSYIYAGEEKKEPEKPEKTPEEIRDDWAEKWIAEQT
jgi:hypothetical protein